MGKSAKLFNTFSETLQKNFLLFFLVLFCLGIVVIKVSSSYILENHSSKEVLEEMDFIASEQVGMINRAMDRNFIPLLFISDYLSKNGGFENNVGSDFLKAMIEGNQWSALRFADLNGNSINQSGEDRGNVSDMPFFYEIVRNGKPQMLRMRWDSYIRHDIYLFYAIPYKENNVLKGVIFAIKQLDNLEYLFHHSLADEPLRIMIVNSQLEVLATNAAARDYLGSEYFRGVHLPDIMKEPIDWEYLAESIKDNQNIQYQYKNINKQLVVQHSIGINDWHLIVSGDREALIKTYSAGQHETSFLIILVAVVIWAVFVYFALTIILSIYRRRLGIENIRFEQERNAILMDKLNCDFFDYNIETDELKIRGQVYTKETMPQLADTLFAGFDEKMFQDALEKVKASGTTYTFDSGSKGDNIWHRIILTPFKDKEGKVTYVFGSILDRTREHNALMRSAEMTSVIDAFAQDFECLYVVDLTTNAFKTINSSGEFGEIGIATIGDDFFDVNNYDYRTHIYLDDYEYVCSMVNKAKIIEALKKDKNYIFNYRVVHNNQPIYYQFRGMLNANDSNILYVGIRNIDASIRHEADMLQKEKAYRNAITSSCVLYGNVNLSKDTLIDFFSTVNSAVPKEVEIPLAKPYSYSQFLKWCVDGHILSAKDKFMESCDSSYLISAFNSGMPYMEFVCRAKFSGGEERTLRVVFFINRNTGSGNIMALCIVYDITELSKKNQQVEDLMEQLKEARVKNSMSQMQPHFLYNALGSIREIILEDPQYASDLVYDFTQHLRACIKSMSNNDLIPFEQEITNINAYVNIEKMRFGDKLKVVYETEKKDFKVVPLGIQPLVENSIRHGIYRRGKAGGTVTIKSFGDGKGNIVIQVIDDGVGFDYEQVKRDVESGKRDSTGMKNLVFRFEKMMGAHVDVQSTIGVGTTITITFPENKI